VTGLAIGDTTLHGSWFWDNWESDGWSMCWETRGESEDEQPVEVQCQLPTGETSAAGSWGTGSLATALSWNQTLTGTGTFTGSTIAEDQAAGGSDTCDFQNSEIEKYKLTGLDATVTSGNHWGPDVVGYLTPAVTYYRQHGRAPCSATVVQDMYISCTDMLHKYTSGNLTVGITSTQVSSKRHSAAAVSTNWP